MSSPDTQHIGVALIFALVYLGMILGGLPRLKLDRSGVALLGAIAMIGLGASSTEQAAKAIDLPTILLLFSFMVISAQMRLGGFYVAVAQRVAGLQLGRAGLLAALIATAAALSAVFSNDIVCLAMTPVVAQSCLQRRLDPVPFLVALACAANIGSAATLIGNPQNMLIGAMLQLPFAGYIHAALPPVLLSLLVLWIWLVFAPHGTLAQPVQAHLPPNAEVASTEGFAPMQTPRFDAWQTGKGLLVACALMGIFLFTDWPREVAALVGAGVLLLSRRFHSSHVMGFVDWELLILFMGLFVVNHAFESTGLAAQAVGWLAGQGVHLADSAVLVTATVALSNLVSNVPAVMLLIPHAQGIQGGVTLALISTFAGNLLLVGSIANLIVVDLAGKSGIHINWRDHLRIGLPVTMVSLFIAVLWVA